MKMRELIILQLLGVLLFALFSLILYKLGVFSLPSAVVLYAIMGVGNVVNARIQLMKPIEEMGLYDNLTGCYNRTKLNLKMKEYKRLKSYAVIFFDVNNLKKMNDVYGHDDGDRMLAEAASALKFWNRYGDVYRVGGDEFIAVVPDMDREKTESILEQWISGLEPFNKEINDDFICDLSWGVYCKQESDNASFEEIMNKADEEMYRMKKEIKAKREE